MTDQTKWGIPEVQQKNKMKDKEIETEYQTLLEMWRQEKKKRQEVEGENTIIKGIGNNSPEMKTLQKENEELKAQLAREKEDRQYDNLVHKRELADLFKGKYEKK